MKIKVCGLTDPDNLAAVAALKPDYAGFIFYPLSPRYVGAQNRLLAASARELSGITKVGVFVNDTRKNIDRAIAMYGLDMVQLHGAETPAFCDNLQKDIPVVKAFSVNTQFDFQILSAWEECAAYFLFDTRDKAFGGSGRSFDWSLLSHYKGSKSFFLSGGISPQNYADAVKINHPSFYGLDLNSRFETAPGIKNITQLKIIIHAIRNR